jgi:hypothetical protein
MQTIFENYPELLGGLHDTVQQLGIEIDSCFKVEIDNQRLTAFWLNQGPILNDDTESLASNMMPIEFTEPLLPKVYQLNINFPAYLDLKNYSWSIEEGKNKTCELIKHLVSVTGVPEGCLRIKLNNKVVKPKQEISLNGSVTMEVHDAVKLQVCLKYSIWLPLPA